MTGGNDRLGYALPNVYKIDPRLNINKCAPMLSNRNYHNCILIQDRYVLALGGCGTHKKGQGLYNETCESYDTVTDTWTLMKPVLVHHD